MDTSSFFSVDLILRKRLRAKKLLFSLLLVLAACPSKGQATNGLMAFQENEKLMFRLAASTFEDPMLFVRHEKGFRHVQWERHGNHVLLIAQLVQSSSGIQIPILGDYKINRQLLGRFPIKKEKVGGYIYIDVTDLFMKDGIKWHKNDIPDTAISRRSYIDKVEHLDNETVISTIRTVESNGMENTQRVDFSFYRLPDPMEPQSFDHRMGYFYEDKHSPANSLARTKKGNITRWRLEKYGDDKQVDIPIRPIIFYFDPETPDKWKPYIKAGVLEWLPAFEAAGFKNAIKIKEVPEQMESAINSVNYSMIRWRTYSDVRGSEVNQGATVHSIIDMRSGEILKADIILGVSYQNLVDSYFVRCGPMDERAKQYPVPDTLMGELIQSLTAHEAGHAFGLRDGHYGEYAYPFEMMRDNNWLQKMGHSPSVMNYARHNYIVQPEDSIPPSLLIPKVGPMDIYQIKWGYLSLWEPRQASETAALLEQLIRQQDTVPWYRFHRNYTLIGPQCTSEVVDNNDPVRSTKLGLKNSKRALELLPEVDDFQQDNFTSKRLYGKILELWYREMLHVVSLIGGYTIDYAVSQPKEAVFLPIRLEKQREAMEFILKNAFLVPDWLSSPNLLTQIKVSQDSDILMNYQLMLLSELFDTERIGRLEQLGSKEVDQDLAQTLFSDLRHGLFFELEARTPIVTGRRMELQLALISLWCKAVEQEKDYGNVDEASYGHGFLSAKRKGLFVSLLSGLMAAIASSLRKVKDPTTRGHLVLCLKKMEDVSF